VWRQLVVQAAHHALGAAVVVLHELMVGAGGFVEGFLVEAFEEKTACVALHLGLGQQDIGNSGWGDMHGGARA